jgi:hypothetical protein
MGFMGFLLRYAVRSIDRGDTVVRRTRLTDECSPGAVSEGLDAGFQTHLGRVRSVDTPFVVEHAAAQLFP